ncbi:hypothetical protein ILP92_13940 [Maribius pontilimi]|uniref:Uncharacterized protein n=1 Tax=Palleronia pontilimi TaxID=1964209 RepID=A0A934IGA5_9RHOB|nr:hypothetical protein [Palleronia pontilimi]MBJ3763852.1 hypothetical protein [Palleronia pontilimi]
MEKDPSKRGDAGRAETREDRLKKALKANMAKRKAQARARANERKNGAQTPEQ